MLIFLLTDRFLMFGIESNIRLSIHFPYSVGSRFNGIVVDIYKGKTLYNTETEI